MKLSLSKAKKYKMTDIDKYSQILTWKSDIEIYKNG